jgi:hypothetical protein
MEKVWLRKQRMRHYLKKKKKKPSNRKPSNRKPSIKRMRRQQTKITTTIIAVVFALARERFVRGSGGCITAAHVAVLFVSLVLRQLCTMASMSSRHPMGKDAKNECVVSVLKLLSVDWVKVAIALRGQKNTFFGGKRSF